MAEIKEVGNHDPAIINYARNALIEPYIKEADKNRIKNIDREIEQLSNELHKTEAAGKTDTQLSDTENIVLNKINFLLNEVGNIYYKAENDYTNDISNKGIDKICEDTKAILQFVSHDFFEERADRYISIANSFKPEKPEDYNQSTIYILATKSGEKNYKNYFDYLFEKVHIQANAVKKLEKTKPEETGKFYKLIHEMVSIHYENTEGYDTEAPIQSGTIEALEKLEEIKDKTYNTDNIDKNTSSLINISENIPEVVTKLLPKAYEQTFNPNITPEDLMQLSFDVSKQGADIKIAVSVDISPLTTNLKGFDKSVHDEVCSFLYAGNQTFTARQIATRLYYGNNPHDLRPSSGQVAAVTKSIEKMRKADAHIDFTEQMEKHFGIQPDEDNENKFVIERYILPLDKINATIRGKQSPRAYSFIQEPPFYAYAKQIKQIGTVPTKAYYIPNISLTEENIIIRDFLLVEIMHMKSRPDWNRTIAADRIIKISEKQLSDRADTRRKQRKKLLDNVKIMLDTWKSNKIIKGYSIELGSKKSIKAFTIDPV